jgi:hypothetical protein
MNCGFEELISPYLDRALSPAESGAVASHLGTCADCQARLAQTEAVRRNLQRLPTPRGNQDLRLKLQVVASRERQRRQLGLASPLWWWDRVRSAAYEAAKPFAVPAFGGFLAAMLLFAAIMPNIFVPIRNFENDVPTGLSTVASVRYMAPIGIAPSDLLIELTVDEQGRMIDYAVVESGTDLMKDPSFRRQLESTLLMTEFTPATKFGEPATGKLRLWLRAGQITIRG